MLCLALADTREAPEVQAGPCLHNFPSVEVRATVKSIKPLIGKLHLLCEIVAKSGKYGGGGGCGVGGLGVHSGNPL